MSDDDSEPYIPEIDEQGSDTVYRVSDLANAQKCMRKLGYNRNYPRTAYSDPMIAGMAVDDALTYHNTQRINGRPGLTEEQLVDYAVAAYREKMQEAEEKFGWIKGGIDLDTEWMIRKVIPLYLKMYDKVCDPVETQGTASWTDPETGLTLVGHVDLIRKANNHDCDEPHLIISDYKFTKKSAVQMPAATSQQLWAYSLLRGEPPYHVELVLLRKLKTPKVETSSHFVTENERKSVIQVLRAVGKMVKNYIWPMADPNEWYCSPKWCDHWERCRGRAEGPAPLPGEEGWDERPDS